VFTRGNTVQIRIAHPYSGGGKGKMLSKQQNVKYGFLHVELVPFINCFPLFSDSPGIES
jgi:hypothetical protein